MQIKTAKKAVLIVLCIVCSALSLFSLVMSLRVVGQIAQKVESNNSPPLFHLVFYLPPTNQAFFSELLQGAQQYCGERNIALSVHQLDESNSTLFTAPYIGADGIVLYSFSDTKPVVQILDTISQKNIPLVLIDHSIQTNKPYTYIGVNNFELGRYIGNYLSKKGEVVKPAIIYSEKSPGTYAERELLEMGFVQTAGDVLSGPIITAKTSRNELDAEEIVSSLLESHPDINTIIFTNNDDTMLYAKTTIELNMVGKRTLIGYGHTAAVMDYLDKGVLAASISVDARTMGYQAMQSAADICRNGYSSSYVNIGFDFILPHGKRVE